MARVPQLLLLAALCVSQARATGVIVALFPQTNLQGEAQWVVPDPSKGCAALPPAFQAASGKVWWSSKDGTAECSAVTFHTTPNCQGPSASIPQAPTPAKGASWETVENDIAKGQYPSIAKAQSVSCTPSAAPGNTSGAPGVVAVATGSDAWLGAINSVRSEGNSAANLLTWDATLASMAQNWTDQLSSKQCGAAQVVLSKIPGSGVSESDVWLSFSVQESQAVDAWAPKPLDISNPRTVRITDSNTKTVGCAKTVCSPGAFFTCLFAPITF